MLLFFSIVFFILLFIIEGPFAFYSMIFNFKTFVYFDSLTIKYHFLVCKDHYVWYVRVLSCFQLLVTSCPKLMVIKHRYLVVFLIMQVSFAWVLSAVELHAFFPFFYLLSCDCPASHLKRCWMLVEHILKLFEQTN